MVRLAQTVEAAFEVESTYGDPPGTALTHLGLLDTFDPRAVEMNITPVPSIGLKLWQLKKPKKLRKVRRLNSWNSIKQVP